MIIDLSEIVREELGEFDVCIVGSGPAGTTVASTLAARRPDLRIAVVESGVRRPTELGNRLRAVLSEGMTIRADSRERIVGGTSTTWAGLCAPFDPIDLERECSEGKPAWPIGYQELAGWYERAASNYRFPRPLDFRLDGATLRELTRDLDPNRWDRLELKPFLAARPPQDFGSEWMNTFTAGGVELFLGATLLDLSGSQRARVSFGRVRSNAGRTHRIRAGTFVVATGAIENARILQLSRNPWEEGLGNRMDQVGRCMMNHPKGYGGIVRLHRRQRRWPYSLQPLAAGWSGYLGLRLREAEQRSRGLLNCCLRLEPLPETSRVGPITSLLHRLRRGVRFARVRNFMEMEPHPENRVVLAGQADEHGRPLPLVRHRPTERDRRSLIALQEALGSELERTGIGRLEDPIRRLDPWPIDRDASHHLGTTRMGTDPATSVVDRNLRLHDVENVYLAGSSVFPTGGCANPTYTIVALSIRLAEHLASTGFGRQATHSQLSGSDESTS